MELRNGSKLRPFPTTHWSLVYNAGEDELEQRNRALTELLLRYLPALRAYLLSRRIVWVDEVEDLLQDFVLEKIVRDQVMAHARASRGKFRSFLLAVLNNYTANWLRARAAQSRSPRSPVESLEAHAPSTADCDPADRHEVEWARAVLYRTFQRMEASCEAMERLDLWTVFAARIILPAVENMPPYPYQDLVRELGLASTTQAANLLATGKRMYQRMLRETIGEYARDEQEIDEEILTLRAVLAR